MNPQPGADLMEALEPVATEEFVAAWQHRLPALFGEARALQLVTLAWHLRQRDPALAAVLADEAQPLLATSAPAVAGTALARLSLVRAEACLLRADFDAAGAQAQAALAAFMGRGEHAGCCDALMLAANIASDLGQYRERDAALARARDCAVAGGDGLRVALVHAALAYNAAAANDPNAETCWAAAMNDLVATGIPVLTVVANDFRVAMAFKRGDHGPAIPWLRDQMAAAGRCGMVRKQISTAANLGLAFSMLNDHGAALDWAQQSLDMARRTGWPVAIGAGLVQMAPVLAKLDQPEAAQAMLDESIDVLAPLTGCFFYLPALSFSGLFALQRGDAQAALLAYAELERKSHGHYREQFLFSVHIGRARALSLLGRGPEAEQDALRALATAVANGELTAQIEVLQFLAQLHDRFELAPPTRAAATSAPLHYLGLALDVAAEIPGFTVPDHLLTLVAEQHAKVGDHARAYACARAAAAAREATHGREVRDRAMATQLRHEAERARAESEHLRRLADVEAKRAQALGSALSDLRAAQTELLRRNELQARMSAEREETLAFLAHDLRAPLTAIAAALSDTPREDTLLRTGRLAQRALTMTDRFLDIARLSRLPLSGRVSLDLASLIDEACETFERRAVQEGRTLEQALVFGVAVLGHREALTRAFCNLVDNALKFSRPGGRVDVLMQVTEQEAGLIVTDDGAGMPVPAQQLLLRTGSDRTPAASGRLGLAIVAEVAKVHEARVVVEASGAGTRVELWLPRATANSP
ncbi:HAMP domain-containing histidine kinase [Ideonella azotifigens]|uniref:histidine kinase n=2 Tax=Ideonella azotifigens TaxID=513160 RepID=A0ABN1JK05_9BURK|nr:HAMP domain-containing sensor histidine kinase [Ideonella azotifigens]MCD2341911.1 HAMP domain-containing histidine kinase [Ideonella azotifigens]